MMSESDLKELIIAVFVELRRMSSALGVRDLLDALRLAEGGAELSDLRDDIDLLWCRTGAEHQHFAHSWQERQSQKTPPATTAEESPPTIEDIGPREQEELLPANERRDTQPQIEPSPAPAVSAVAVKPPSRLPLRSGPAELSGFWPISRRAIEYGWEYLRRPRQDGPATIIDVEATVEKAAREGYVLRPVYRQETTDHSHLVLLVDRRGSMTPFHTLARSVVETAERAKLERKIGRLDVYYFRNVAAGSFHIDPFLTELDRIDGRPATIDESLLDCNRDTRILILSDAGAARGRRALGRIEATDEMLFHLRRKTEFIAWVNPMSEKRWGGTSASIIARCVPMFEMTRLGFHNAIRALRGQGRGAERQKAKGSRVSGDLIAGAR
jgi:hypothetical protein